MELFKIFWSFIRPQQKYFWATLSFRAIADLAGWIGAPMIFAAIIAAMSNFAGGDRNALNEYFFLLYGSMIALNIFAFTLSARLYDYFWMTCEYHLIQNAKRWCIENIFPKSMDFFEGNFAGSTLAKINRFSSLEQLLSGLVQDIFPIFIQGLATVIIVFTLNKNIGFVFLIWIVVYISVVYWISRYKRFPAGLKESAANSKTSAYIVDALGNMNLIKSSSAEEKEQKRIQNAILEEATARRNVDFVWLWSNLFQSISVTIFELSLVYFFFISWREGSLSIAEIVLIHTYAAQLFVKIWGISSVINRFSRIISDAWEMLELVKIPISVNNAPSPQNTQLGKGNISFQNVSFQYPKTNLSIFSNFSVDIPAGKKIGLVGSSGAGKSTFAKLLLRFVDPIKGNVLIDGQNITEITQQELRKKISFVPQDPALLHRSIEENIIFSAEHFTETDIENAIKKSFVDEFLKDIPEGKNALVGERGVKLSGGQRQRIAIARAFLKNAPIILLDEATSALDSESESKIQQSFEELFIGKTVIAIAHRLSTLKKMDEIWVLEDGNIVEQGNHEELLQRNGVYANLWNHQSSGFLAETEEENIL